MRCKAGDLAVVTRTVDEGSPVLGRIVEVCSLDGEHSLYGPMWRVRVTGRPVATVHGTAAAVFHHPDDWMRPLRDGEGQDQTLTWAGKPAPLEAKDDVAA